MKSDYESLAITSSESLYSLELKTAKANEGIPLRLRLPKKLNTRGALGLEVALIQLIATWLNSGEYKKIFHTYQTDKPESFEDLCHSIYGIAALSMIDEVWDLKKNILPKGLILDKAKTVVDALRSGDFRNSFKPRYFGIPYIKKIRYDKEFDMPFYNGEDVIKSEAFYRVSERILRDNIVFNSRFQRLKNMISLEDLSDLLWEVFKNTHDHGRQDVSGNIISENFRSVIIQQQDITDAYFDQWCGINPSEAQIKFKNNWYGQSKKYFFLDLSVIDFGSGFVNLAKDKAGAIDEVEVFLKCLENGWSRLSDKSRGSGLTKVLSCIHKYKGWLRIRTGNLLLEKTFAENTSYEVEKADIRIMPTSVIGTSVHISLPLQNLEKL